MDSESVMSGESRETLALYVNYILSRPWPTLAITEHLDDLFYYIHRYTKKGYKMEFYIQ